VAVTAHIITDDWKMKSFCLATHEVTSAHTADNIEQVVGITTDNAKNVKNAVDSLKFTHFGCIGHTLQLNISTTWVYLPCFGTRSQTCGTFPQVN